MLAERDVEAFRAFLERRGLKLTTQRALVLERALEVKKHFSAESLFGDLRAHAISKATVYRTLSLLVAANLLEAVDLLDKGYKLYERASGHDDHHDHLICMTCGAIVEFHDERIEAAQHDVAREHGFQIVQHTHKIYGLCSACRSPRLAGGRGPPRVPPPGGGNARPGGRGAPIRERKRNGHSA